MKPWETTNVPRREAFGRLSSRGCPTKVQRKIAVGQEEKVDTTLGGGSAIGWQYWKFHTPLLYFKIFGLERWVLYGKRR